MDTPEITTSPPISENNDGISIHLSYLRRDVSDIKITLNKLEGNYVTQNDFKEHLKADDDHEQRIRSLEKALWKYVGFSSAISAILAVGGSALIEHFFK